MKFIISKNELYFAVRKINRLPDAYDEDMCGIYNTLSSREQDVLTSNHITIIRA